MPHVPQLLESFSVPEEHWQEPLWQLSPELHLLPQVPQSLLVAFNVCPSGHTQ